MSNDKGLVAHCKKTGKDDWEQGITNGPNGPEMVQAYHFNITSEFKVCITNFKEDGKPKGAVFIGDHTCQPMDIQITDEEAKEIYDHIKRIGVID